MNKTTSEAKKHVLIAILACSSWLVLSGCGGNFLLPGLDETGQERATEHPDSVNASGERIVLSQALNARKNVSDILEFAVELPAGTVLDIPDGYDTVHYDYRKTDGTLERSSTGFIQPVHIVTIPQDYADQFPTSRIEQLNKTRGGLHVSASVVGSSEGANEGDFSALKAASPGSDFLISYEASGKPKFSYLSKVKARFGPKLNKGVNPASQSSAEKKKWSKIYEELVRVSDRTKNVPRSLLMISRSDAIDLSIAYEEEGVVPKAGAWTIAVEATAARHGFPNVPCAEFMSQIVREAYKRAGYKHTDDFNEADGNPLIWKKTAAVRGLSQALYDAGWIPWDSGVYRPMTGAVLMHRDGQSPGHTFMSAGDDGRFIIDNGAPHGRDLRKTNARTIQLMFLDGVFFLPPGVNPKRW